MIERFPVVGKLEVTPEKPPKKKFIWPLLFAIALLLLIIIGLSL